MLMALPNPDKTFTCTLFAPYEGAQGFSEIPDAAAARSYFEMHFPDVLDLVPDFDRDWTENPTSSLVMTRCAPWHQGILHRLGGVLLIQPLMETLLETTFHQIL